MSGCIPPAYGGDDSEHVNVENELNVIYVKGDEETDGSLRLIPDTSFQTEVEFQLRESGVWNDTGILIAASTVYLGRELQLSGGGEWLLTADENTEIISLVPHVRFDEMEGTEETVIVPKVGTLQENVIVQGDNTGEATNSAWTFGTGSDTDVLGNKLIFQTGSAAATGDVTIELRRDNDTGRLFYKRTYPQANWPANSTIELETDGLVELRENGVVFIILTCTGDLTLRTDFTNTTPYFAGDFYELDEDYITPDNYGGALRLLTFDNEGHAVCDNNGDAVWANA